MADARVVIPIGKRPVDIVFCVLFVLFAFIAVFLDSANVFAPAGKNGSFGMTRAYEPSAVWPPPFFMDKVLWWCEIADPLLCGNPMWFKAMCFVSPFIYAPFYLVAVFAIIKGLEWIRIPILVVAGGLFYSLTVILVEQAYGEYASHNLPLIFAAYTSYWLLPVFLMIRFSTAHPFTRSKSEISQKAKAKLN